MGFTSSDAARWQSVSVERRDNELGCRMNIKLELSLEEVNQILTTLGQLPYAQVATLIEKMREQAKTQLEPKPSGE
jgi:hypothetical protein